MLWAMYQLTMKMWPQQCQRRDASRWMTSGLNVHGGYQSSTNKIITHFNLKQWNIVNLLTTMFKSPIHQSWWIFVSNIWVSQTCSPHCRWPTLHHSHGCNVTSSCHMASPTYCSNRRHGMVGNFDSTPFLMWQLTRWNSESVERMWCLFQDEKELPQGITTRTLQCPKYSVAWSPCWSYWSLGTKESRCHC